MRTNIVGTTWLWVISYSSTSFRYSSASKFSMATIVAPSMCIDMQKRSGAAW